MTDYLNDSYQFCRLFFYHFRNDFAHDGLFDFYVQSLQNIDSLIEDLWTYVQNDACYKDNTYVIIITDHGRGEGAEKASKWTSHGLDVSGAEQTWMAVLGPDVRALVKQAMSSYIPPKLHQQY